MENKEKITGYFERVIFQNKENYYTVAVFYTDTLSLDDVVVVGNIPDIDYDSEYSLFGNFVEHPNYGIQFSFLTYEKIAPSDKDSLINFLSSPLFPHIGLKTASYIYDSLGDDLINIIKGDPKIVKTLKISVKQKDSLLSGISNNSNDFEHLVNYFSSFGLSINQIIKLEKEYKENTIEMVSENPYRMLEEISGIGFKTCDKLAKSMGFDLDSVQRAEALLIDLVLNHIASTGDSYIEIEDLSNRYTKAYPKFNFIDVLMNVLSRRTLINDNNNVYHYTQYDSEQTISAILNNFPNYELDKVNEEVILEILSEIESDINIAYDESQKSAIIRFLNSNLSILTGGPGTGKTTIINAMVKVYKKLYPNISIALCAPTGRAAKRLSELTGSDAFTIHSLLKWDLESNTFAFNKDEPLVYDILVIDEFSMVDQWLFSKLLEASANIKKILLVGDENQLPSVLPGALLADLIKSDLFPVEKLSKIYRQKDGSSVIFLADKINREQYADITFEDEVRFIEANSNQVDDAILQIIKNYLDNGYSIDDIQVLAPMYRNSSGINILNNKIQDLVNPKSSDKVEFKYGYHTFREGDKVLQLKNLIDMDVSNGDIGTIVEIDDTNKSNITIMVNFDGNYVEYSNEMFTYLTFAYCISIHKSQGSEYPIVIMPIVKSSTFMLRKRLLYTAITRSKKNLLLVGDKDLFLDRIVRDEDHLRKTSLVKHLKNFNLVLH